MFQRYVWPVAALLGLISAPIAAEESSPATETDNPPAAGVQVFIDEDTGEIRSPTAAETAAIAEQFRRRYIDLSIEKPVVYHADGSISKELGTRHRMYSVARVSDDGKLDTQCLPAEQAADFLAGGDTVATPAGIEALGHDSAEPEEAAAQ